MLVPCYTLTLQYTACCEFIFLFFYETSNCHAAYARNSECSVKSSTSNWPVESFSATCIFMPNIIAYTYARVKSVKLYPFFVPGKLLSNLLTLCFMSMTLYSLIYA